MKEKGKTPESFSEDDVCAASTVRRAFKRGTISIRLAQRIAGYLEVPVTSFADIDVVVRTEKKVVLTYPVVDGKNARDVGLAIVESMERNSEKREDDGKNRKEAKMGKRCKRKKLKKIAKLTGYWGTLVPTLVMEECGELIQAVSKVERDRSLCSDETVYSETTKNLVEKMADVIIGVEALRVYYGISSKKLKKQIAKKTKKRC